MYVCVFCVVCTLGFACYVRIKMKFKCPCPPPVEVETLRELCDMRESTWQDVFTSAELECVIENICTK